jgi:hypothetical protein
MARGNIRSSTQLYVDDNLDIKSNRIVNLAPGIDGTDGVNMNQLGALSGAMIYKGTVGVGGTYTLATFDALATYDVGWTYRVITAGTSKGVEVEPGDLFIALTARAGSGELDSDWTVAQTNIDGAVIKADYNANTILAANANDEPLALEIGEDRFVGRLAGGNIAALTVLQMQTILGIVDPTMTYTASSRLLTLTPGGDTTELPLATQSLAGLLSSTDKTKLDDITDIGVRSYRVTPTGDVNNTNKVFTIAQDIVSGSEEIFLNGLLQNGGAANDYTITYANPATITFNVAPDNAPFVDVILVNYSVA